MLRIPRVSSSRVDRFIVESVVVSRGREADGDKGDNRAEGQGSKQRWSKSQWWVGDSSDDRGEGRGDRRCLIMRQEAGVLRGRGKGVRPRGPAAGVGRGVGEAHVRDDI